MLIKCISFLKLLFLRRQKEHQKSRWKAIGLFAALCCLIFDVKGQEVQREELGVWLNKWIEDFIDFNELDADFDLNTLQEDVLAIAHSRPDINEVSQEILSQLYFLTDLESQGIINYLHEFGPLISIYELQSIPALPLEKAKVLAQIFTVRDELQYVSDYSLSLDINKNQLFIKTRWPLEMAKGYEDGGNYNGDRSYQYLRFRHKSALGWNLGFTAEKDAGEAWRPTDKGLYDFHSAFLSKQNPTRYIRQVIFGDYRVSWGQGLVLNQSLRYGKSSLVNQVMQGASDMKPYSSVDENNFFRGVALQLEPSNLWQVQVFGSALRRDANITTNMEEDDSFSNLQISGLHRTDAEIEDRRRLRDIAYGASIIFSPSRRWRLGMNSLNHHFDKSRIPGQAVYQRFDFKGNFLHQTSLDFKWYAARFTAFGELARSHNNAFASLMGILIPLDRKIDLSIVYRHYSPEYQSINANSFAETFGTRNEKGMYVGVNIQLDNRWSFNAYADQWSHSWPRIRVDGPSAGHEFLFRVNYKLRKSHSFYAQYRIEHKEENSSIESPIDRLTPRVLQRLRFHSELIANPQLKFRTRLEFSSFEKDNTPNKGWLIYQDVLWNIQKSSLSLMGRISFFGIDSFSSAIYAFENDLTYEFQIPAFNNRGFRYYMVAKYQMSRMLRAEFKFAQSVFKDLDSVGSGNDLTLGNQRSILKAQLIVSF